MKLIITLTKYLLFVYLIAEVIFHYTSFFVLTSSYQGVLAEPMVTGMEANLYLVAMVVATIIFLAIVPVLSRFLYGKWNIVIVSLIAHVYFVIQIFDCWYRFTTLRGVITFTILYLIIVTIIGILQYSQKSREKKLYNLNYSN